jgi:hypothetical protein
MFNRGFYLGSLIEIGVFVLPKLILHFFVFLVEFVQFLTCDFFGGALALALSALGGGRLILGCAYKLINY